MIEMSSYCKIFTDAFLSFYKIFVSLLCFTLLLKFNLRHWGTIREYRYIGSLQKEIFLNYKLTVSNFAKLFDFQSTEIDSQFNKINY